jgi:hypothetical protein
LLRNRRPAGGWGIDVRAGIDAHTADNIPG